MMPSWFQILIVLVLVVLLFGRGKISGLMGDVAQGIKSFKKGMADDDASPDHRTDDPKTIDLKATETAGGVPPSAQSGAKPGVKSAVMEKSSALDESRKVG